MVATMEHNGTPWFPALFQAWYDWTLELPNGSSAHVQTGHLAYKEDLHRGLSCSTASYRLKD